MASSTSEIVGSVGLPILSVDPAGATSFAAIAELIEVSANEPSREVINMTHTDLTNGRTKQAGGWINEGEYTFTFNYREDTLTQLKALEGVDGANWQLEWTDPSHAVTDPNDTFIGFISGGVSKSMPVEGERWTISVTITIVEVATFTEGTDA